MLKKFGKEHQTLLLPLGGKTLINDHSDTEAQLLVLTRITAPSNTKALIDRDTDGPTNTLDPARTAFQNLCRKLGIHCHVLEKRALENYFPQRAIDLGVGSGHPQIGDFGRQNWGKNNNVKIRATPHA